LPCINRRGILSAKNGDFCAFQAGNHFDGIVVICIDPHLAVQKTLDLIPPSRMKWGTLFLPDASARVRLMSQAEAGIAG